jgi:hypothetical protein
MTDDRLFEINCEKLRKHFRTYCTEMGMEYTQWTDSIYVAPQMMMEGESPERLIADFTHRHTGKKLTFKIAKYGRRGYEINQLV